MIEISGTTRIFPVIGWPVEQVKAPTLFNAYFQKHDIDACVVPFKIAPERYSTAVRVLMEARNVGGIFVSIPHKPGTLEAVDEATSRAMLAGACNAVYRNPDGKIMGDLIDGEGFLRAFDRTCGDSEFAWKNSRALVVGCGGVGSAIAASLATRGIAEIALFDMRTELVESLLARLKSGFPDVTVRFGTPVAAGFDLVVNSTPLGMNPDDPVPVSLDDVASSCIVADCGMKTEMSKLLIQAQQRGCRIQKGKEMMIEQAPLYLELFGWPGVISDDFRALEAL
jgi:shikimate dehydrogenase